MDKKSPAFERTILGRKPKEDTGAKQTPAQRSHAKHMRSVSRTTTKSIDPEKTNNPFRPKVRMYRERKLVKQSS